MCHCHKVLQSCISITFIFAYQDRYVSWYAENTFWTRILKLFAIFSIFQLKLLSFLVSSAQYDAVSRLSTAIAYRQSWENIHGSRHNALWIVITLVGSSAISCRPVCQPTSPASHHADQIQIHLHSLRQTVARRYACNRIKRNRDMRRVTWSDTHREKIVTWPNWPITWHAPAYS